MRKSIATIVGTAVMTLALGVGSVWADAKITITRERNNPESVQIKAGESVEWINASGGTAHVWFGGSDAIRFYIGSKDVGKGGSTVMFDKPGTYEYTVHVTGIKAHSHTGTIIVK